MRGVFLKILVSNIKYFSLRYNSTFQWTSKNNYIAKLITDELIINQNFITLNEELSLVDEIDTAISRQKYQKNHWDYAISEFRELERKAWRSTNHPVISRLREINTKHSTLPKSELENKSCGDLTLPHMHILDLAENGEVKPHVDSVRFCGDSIAIISMLDDCILRLAVAPPSEIVGVPSDRTDLLSMYLPQPGTSVDIRVPRRSVYIMRGASRYLFTHAILSNNEVLKLKCDSQAEGSNFEVYDLHRGRRISILCRIKPMISLIQLENGNQIHEAE